MKIKTCEAIRRSLARVEDLALKYMEINHAQLKAHLQPTHTPRISNFYWNVATKADRLAQ